MCEDNEWEEKRACYVTPDLSYELEGERRRWAKMINGMRKNKKSPIDDAQKTQKGGEM